MKPQVFCLVLTLGIFSAVSVYAQPWGYGHYLPLDYSWEFQDERDSFHDMKNRWGFTGFSVDYLSTPNNQGATPAAGFSVLEWFSKHGSARFIEVITHGASAGPAVEAFDSESARNQRYSYLTTSEGWIPWGTPGAELFTSRAYESTSPDTIFLICVTAAGLRNSMPDMEATWNEPRAIALLNWCNSWDDPAIRAVYLDKKAAAVFSNEGTSVPTNFVPIKRCFACQDFRQSPSYDAFACDAYEDVQSLHSSVQLDLSFGSCYSLASSAGISGNSCNSPVVNFEERGKCGSTVYWVAREETVTSYYVLGFNALLEAPSYSEQVAGNPGGGNNRTVFYTHEVRGSYPFWEIVEVDKDPLSANTFSGYFEEGPRPLEFDSWAAQPIRLSSAELTRNTKYVSSGTPALLRDDGNWVGADSLALGDAQQSLKGSDTAVDCRTCVTYSQPDSSCCADWLVVSHDGGWAALGRDRQRQYLPGRCLAGWTQSSDPEAVRILVKIVWCYNNQWNEWARNHGNPRRFNEQFPITIIGSPGIYVNSDPLNLHNVGIAYDINGLDHIVDGRMAMPWQQACDDSIMVPYTRIPARSSTEIDQAYNVAQSYSAGTEVDPAGHIIRIAGDTQGTGFLCEVGAVLREPVDFLNSWTMMLRGPVNEMIRRTDGCEINGPKILAQVNAGASLCVELANESVKNLLEHVWPLNDPGNYTRDQVMAVLFPSCSSADMIGDDDLGREPWAYRMLNNASNKTRFAFFNGFTDAMNYAVAEKYYMILAMKIDEHKSESVTWQQVVFETQQDLAKDVGWDVVQEITCVGAPAIIRRNLTIGIGDSPVEVSRLSVRAWPNPLMGSGSAVIEFNLPKSGRVRVDVHNVSGREVRNLVDGEYGPGRHAVTWDGKGKGGETLGQGVFFVRVWTGADQEITKIVRIP